MFLAGLHGLEIEGPGLRFAHNAVALAAPAISLLAKDLRRAVKPLPGVFVEDKTLLRRPAHARRVESRPAARHHAIQRARRAAAERGHGASSARRPGARAAAQRRLGQRATPCAPSSATSKPRRKETVWPVYIGDDATDEDAFEEIGTNGLTIAVGRRPPARRFRSTIRPPSSVS